MSPRVWLKFEKKKKDGTILKLRIQDLPPERIGEAADLMVKHFLRDEPFRKAVGFLKNPEAVEEYREYIGEAYHDPATRSVMCCADTDDDDDETPDIMGISSIAVSTAVFSDLTTSKKTEETKKMIALYFYALEAYDVIKELNPPSYYNNKSILVLPKYRGYGIGEKFLTVRRLMCAAHNISMTGAWMTTFSSQISAERDGWEILSEIEYKEILQKHGLTMTDELPPTMKFFVARPHPEYSSMLS